MSMIENSFFFCFYRCWGLFLLYGDSSKNKQNNKDNKNGILKVIIIKDSDLHLPQEYFTLWMIWNRQDPETIRDSLKL